MFQDFEWSSRLDAARGIIGISGFFEFLQKINIVHMIAVQKINIVHMIAVQKINIVHMIAVQKIKIVHMIAVQKINIVHMIAVQKNKYCAHDCVAKK